MSDNTPELPSTPSEFAPFESFARGDRIRFFTRRGVLVPAPEGHRKKNVLQYTDVWRTGTVLAASHAALTVDCDMPNPIGHRAILRKAAWEKRQPTKIQPDADE